MSGYGMDNDAIVPQGLVGELRADSETEKGKAPE